LISASPGRGVDDRPLWWHYDQGRHAVVHVYPTRSSRITPCAGSRLLQTPSGLGGQGGPSTRHDRSRDDRCRRPSVGWTRSRLTAAGQPVLLHQPKFWASRGSRRPSAWCSSSGIPTQRSRFQPGASACGCRISRGRCVDPQRRSQTGRRRLSRTPNQPWRRPGRLKASTTNGLSRGLMRQPQAEGEATVSGAALSGLHAADLVPMHRLTPRGVLVRGVSPTHRGRARSARRSRASRTSWSRSGPA
jgi:hypothetical protein